MEQRLDLQRRFNETHNLLAEHMERSSLLPERDRPVKNPMARCVNCGIVGPADSFYQAGDQYACVDPEPCIARQASSKGDE